MRVITCVSDKGHYGYRNFLEPSCEFFNLALTTLEHKGKWSSYRLKDFHVLAYLQTLPPEEIVLFTDGYDTMFLCSEEEILAKYRAFQKPLVFTAEKNCWPYRPLFSKYPKAPTPLRYLNSGGFIGEAGVLRYLLQKYPAPPSSYSLWEGAMWRYRRILRRQEIHPDWLYRWSNQYYWAQVFLSNQDLIALDCRADIFLGLSTDIEEWSANMVQFRSSREESEIYMREKMRFSRECVPTGDRLLYQPTGTIPCQLHFNSPVTKLLARNNHFDIFMPWKL